MPEGAGGLRIRAGGGTGAVSGPPLTVSTNTILYSVVYDYNLRFDS
jgi:hypothetical protein